MIESLMSSAIGSHMQQIDSEFEPKLVFGVIWLQSVSRLMRNWQKSGDERFL